MLRSMTGYGKAEVHLQAKNVIIEVKSLNSKNADIGVKVPFPFRDKEHNIRQLLAEKLVRGKIDFNLYYDNNENQSAVNLNKELIRSYFHELNKLSEEIGIEAGEGLLGSVLRLPDVLKPTQNEVDDGEWESITEGILSAVSSLDNFRYQEGKSLFIELQLRVANISTYLFQLGAFEKPRIERIKERLGNSLRELGIRNETDSNRFEQELIFYLEKLDISEEKTRLTNHCSYFLKTMESEQAAGKKLSFISQEMGREINTIGSKANDYDIQHLVVKMKDELEKIKEQCLNIL